MDLIGGAAIRRSRQLQSYGPGSFRLVLHVEPPLASVRWSPTRESLTPSICRLSPSAEKVVVEGHTTSVARLTADKGCY